MATTFKGHMSFAHPASTGPQQAAQTRGSIGPATGLILAATTSLVLWVLVVEFASWLARAVL